MLQAIARDKPRRLTHPKQIAAALSLQSKGLLKLQKQLFQGKVTAVYDLVVVRAKELPLASGDDFYTPRTQELL